MLNNQAKKHRNYPYFEIIPARYSRSLNILYNIVKSISGYFLFKLIGGQNWVIIFRHLLAALMEQELDTELTFAQPCLFFQ